MQHQRPQRKPRASGAVAPTPQVSLDDLLTIFNTRDAHITLAWILLLIQAIIKRGGNTPIRASLQLELARYALKTLDAGGC